MIATEIETREDVAALCRDLAERAKAASRRLAVVRPGVKNDWLKRAADALRKRAEEVLEANARDVESAPGYGLNAAAIDRLTLNTKRLEEIAKALEEIIGLPDPVGEVI